MVTISAASYIEKRKYIGSASGSLFVSSNESMNEPPVPAASSPLLAYVQHARNVRCDGVKHSLFPEKKHLRIQTYHMTDFRRRFYVSRLNRIPECGGTP